MREAASTYKFEQGLRAWEDMGRDLPGLLECYNMVPRRGKLLPFEPLVNPTAGIESVLWPFPQLFCGKKANYLLGRIKVFGLDSSFNITEMFMVAPSIRWHVADFWDYVVFTNGAEMYERNATTGLIGGSALPLCGCIENFKGQLVAGNVTGHESNVFVYGDIGYANLTPSVSAPESGTVVMPWQGEINFVKRLGDSVVVYGDNGISVLSSVPAQTTNVVAFKHEEAFPFGVVAVGGDIHSHVFVDVTGSLWKIGADLKPQELGYKEFLSPMIGNEIYISFDPRSGFRDYYISDGAVCYVLTEMGLAQVFQLVSSCQVYWGNVYGTVIDELGTTDVTVETDTLDMGLRSRKATEWLEVACEGDWNVQMLSSVDGKNFTPGPVFPLPAISGGNVRPKMAGVDFRVKLTALSYADKLLEQMHIRWKMEDRRTIRGAYARKATSGSNQ